MSSWNPTLSRYHSELDIYTPLPRRCSLTSLAPRRAGRRSDPSERAEPTAPVKPARKHKARRPGLLRSLPLLTSLTGGLHASPHTYTVYAPEMVLETRCRNKMSKLSHGVSVEIRRW